MTHDPRLSQLFDLQVDEYIDMMKNGVPVFHEGVEVGKRKLVAAELNVIRQFLAEQKVSANPVKHPGLQKMASNPAMPFTLPTDEDLDADQTYQ